MTANNDDLRTCATCGDAITDRSARCEICRADYCLACGSAHLCNATCLTNGCLPGKCVRVVTYGGLAPEWGVPVALLRPGKASASE